MNPELVVSVYELASDLKRVVERSTEGVWVEGEAGRIQRPTSGHVYFTLKDEERDAAIDCVMYRREALRFGKMLEEGARLQLHGRATFYPPRGRLQWIADAARPAGRGALLLALEKLKQRLAEEGLLDPDRKRPLPSDPRVIGVVTSKTGAAFADIRAVARRRGNVRLVLSPALVQGEGAPESILRALDHLELLPGLDVVILGRGGGSKDDLMAFNDERVVRRVARMRVPVVSAVGHEIDVSLCDLVADARAATPSQAAELVVPDSAARRELLLRLERHLGRAMKSRVERGALELARLRRRLGDPRFFLVERQQELDEWTERLTAHERRVLSVERRRVLELSRRLALRHPRAVLAQSRAELSPLSGRLQAALRRRLDRGRAELENHARALDALSPLAILGRGYALVFDEQKRPVREAASLRPGAPVTVRLQRGAFVARVEQLSPLVETTARLGQETAGNEKADP